ncbi:unnamed protein product [Lepeophtheirus salmonis]|uniref:(salmon louse) hypothetical protein n=1 Tax=Lepeophtheirus salmonis TaxID=72036 RepID=A0A7R8CZM9_LEPSM|nr:unnamed protein product [Lepeophtheirus salmonis]CAF2935758.1 unnamed protein product [Lepeophtheirus salmonis]
MEAFHSFSVLLKALRKKPIPKIGPFQMNKKALFCCYSNPIQPLFALVEVKTRWKEVVAYNFTGSSFNKKDVALALKEIAIAAYKSGLIATHKTSDMGPCNQGV